MKLSQKEVLAYYKETKGKFCVYTFNPATKKRESAYINLDCLTAFQEMVNRAQQGFLILVLDLYGSKMADMWEMYNGGRISYYMCKQWAIRTYLVSKKIESVQS